MTQRISVHYYISGKVQGVWFRSFTKEQADQLGLTGWVRNLSDGRVEVLACGDKAKIAQLHEWLKVGPKLANITEVASEELPYKEYKKFDVI